MTTSGRGGRAKWPIVACSAGCLNCSPCSSSYAFILSFRKTKTLHYLDGFQNKYYICDEFVFVACSQVCESLHVD